MADYSFSNMPSVSIARSKFHRTFTHNVSFNLGEIVVLGCDEVIPGSTHRLDYGSLIRMSTPIAPIMDDIQYDIFSFFVPMRILWDNWKQFMGENIYGAGQINGVNSSFIIPTFTIYGSGINTIADDLGIPAYENGNGPASVSMLPFRGVFAIYNRFFRNQNVEAPLAYSKGNTALAGEALSYGLELSSSGGSSYGPRLVAYKLPDYFTSSLPYAQKGDPVSILPDGASAPVGWIPSTSGGGSASVSLGSTWSSGVFKQATVTGYGSGPMVADLGQAVNATINDLRFAFQLQKFLEKDSNYGSRYWEILHAHYAVTSPDATLQDPQLLGHAKFDINIQQVLQTTGYVSPSQTDLGTPGANSVTGKKGHICTFSAVEHGYFITVGVARQKCHTYSQGLNRMWSRSARTDFYFPVFANLGAQAVKLKEIDMRTGFNGQSTFGYQEAWAEYRYLPSYNSGLLNPTRTGALDFWTLAENFTSSPTLGPTFLKESRDNIVRALTTGVTGPDFIGSFYFQDTVVNPMPLYSIPGFSDHH